MSASLHILESLSIFDMAGVYTYVALAAIASATFVFLTDENVRRIPFPLTATVAIVALLYCFSNFIQYTILRASLNSIAELEANIAHSNTRPHPYLTELDRHKSEMIGSMKDAGTFGEHKSTYRSAWSLTRTNDYLHNPYTRDIVVRLSQRCFNTLPEVLDMVTHTYPVSVSGLQNAWEAHANAEGTLHPLCKTQHVMEYLQ